MAVAAFLGLGVMGHPMAGHLATAGHQVTVYNRTATRADHWVEQHEGRVGSTPAEAAADADAVFMCVGNDDDVRQVALGADGALAAMAPGTVLVDHSTASAALARELHAVCAEAGVGFVDAPISGGQSGAEQGILTIMAGGEPAHFAAVEPVMAAYSQARTLIGPAGSGQLTKMVNQIAIAGLIEGLSEALAFGQRAHLDMDKVLDTITHGAAGSWYMANRGATMVADEFDFGFAVEWMQKDLGICLDEGERLDADLSVTRLVASYYDELAEQGGARWDCSALIRRLSAPAD
ncbi:MAG: NAD(P)-dependent oxidoreductase [Acidimicrobiales bacterium]